MNKEIYYHMTEIPHTVGQDATVKKAREMMREYGYHHLPVLNGRTVVGMVSERDLRTAEEMHQDENKKIKDVMNDQPFIVDRHQEVKTVIQEMLKLGYSSAIVRGTDHEPWGLFTTTDALRLLVAVL